MDEAHALLPADAFPEYSVQRKEAGRFVADPLREYRHAGPITLSTCTRVPVTLATVQPPAELHTKVRPVAEIPESRNV